MASITHRPERVSTLLRSSIRTRRTIDGPGASSAGPASRTRDSDVFRSGSFSSSAAPAAIVVMLRSLW
jgi:hypothetical protein